MRREEAFCLAGQTHIVVITDEPTALRQAQACGRAVVGVERGNFGENRFPGASYVVPVWEDATRELAELVLLRHLGLPWPIARSERLLLRELQAEDACRIPAAECWGEERVFSDPQRLEAYVKRQYAFFEYGIWAVLRRDTNELIGLCGLDHPRLLPQAEKALKALGPGQPWLELGYRIFAPYRRRGYGLEAAKAAADYGHEVLEVRLCASIAKENKASRRLVEGLGLRLITETDSAEPESYLLYAESCG